jgi:hypothetical protein
MMILLRPDLVGGVTKLALVPFRFGVAWVKDRWVAVGTTGSDVS